MWDHIVKPGESLWIISQRYQKDFNAVLRLNPQIPDKNKIFAGQVVHMPDPPPQGQVIVGPITVSAPSDYTGNEPAVPLDLVGPVDPDAFFDVRASHVPPNTRPIFDDSTHAVVGYVYQSKGFYRYYDVCGTFITTDELALQEPIIDPIDVILIVADLAAIVGKGLLKAGVRMAARAGTKITLRALAAGALETMRIALRRLLVARNLKFTATTAARMASKDRHVPLQILQLAVRFGKRTADSQGVKGAFRYAIKMLRNDGEYVLEVVVREIDSTVLHFQYGTKLPL